MTAEEKLIANFHNGSFIEINSGDKDHIKEIMIEFAKYHVKKALKIASEEAYLKIDYDNYTISDQIDKDSILEAYPLENIK